MFYLLYKIHCKLLYILILLRQTLQKFLKFLYVGWEEAVFIMSF